MISVVNSSAKWQNGRSSRSGFWAAARHRNARSVPQHMRPAITSRSRATWSAAAWRAISKRWTRPELRKFARNTLRQAAANRASYVAAALTVMRAYLAAGVPEVCGPFGSYAEWSAMVRSPLVWLGEPDPVASVDITQAEDPELAELRELGEWWRGELKLDEDYLSARLVEIANEAPAGFNTNPLKDLFLRVASDKDGNISGLIRKRSKTSRAAFRLSRIT